jgi:hypothetical protein
VVISVLQKAVGVATLEQMADASVSLVGSVRKRAVEAPHAVSDVWFRRLDHHVIVVRHQAVRVDDPGVVHLRLGECPEECPAVLVVDEDRFSIVAPDRDVVPAAGDVRS